MASEKFDLIILGGGPIASIIAYLVSLNKEKLGIKKIGLIQKEPDVELQTAYLNAGGSIRWYFEDEELKLATEKTKNFILSIKDKANLSLIEDNYFFVHKSIFVPSINIAGKKLVEFLKNESIDNGVEIFNNTEYLSFEKDKDYYLIKTNNKSFSSERVVSALGYKNKEYFNLDLEIEKRQLFVLNLDIDWRREKLPHTIIRFNDGIVYFFVKKFDNGYRLVLGQEDIFEHSLEPQPENYFKKFFEIGLDKILPFLKDIEVEKILWGYDVKNKKPLINEIDKNFWAVNCGSAVRSLYYIGEKFLKVLEIGPVV